MIFLLNVLVMPLGLFEESSVARFVLEKRGGSRATASLCWMIYSYWAVNWSLSTSILTRLLKATSDITVINCRDLIVKPKMWDEYQNVE